MDVKHPRPIGQQHQFGRMPQLEGENKLSNFTRENLDSHSNFRSQMSRSMKSLKMPWYQRPMMKNNQYMNIQKGAIIMAIVGIVSGTLTSRVWIIQVNSPCVSVCVALHDRDGNLRPLLLLDGGAWLDALRLLHNFLRVCLRRKHARPQCPGHFRNVLRNGSLCDLCHEHYAGCGSEKGERTSDQSFMCKFDHRLTDNFLTKIPFIKIIFSWNSLFGKHFRNSDSKAWTKKYDKTKGTFCGLMLSVLGWLVMSHPHTSLDYVLLFFFVWLSNLINCGIFFEFFIKFFEFLFW